jgi:2-dehydro-3-deoxygluconokinase
VRANGGTVDYHGIYRAGLWATPAHAAAARDAAIPLTNIGLPTFEDEQRISGSADPAQVAWRWHESRCGEVVVKLGERGCLLSSGELQPPPAPVSVLDSSGAGDAFNAGYLDGRLQAVEPAEAALRGQRLAAWVLTRRGAIPPRDRAAPYNVSAITLPE